VRDVLVTGGAGFIGSHCVQRLLKEGYRVTVIDDFNGYYDPQIKRANFREILTVGRPELFEVDICDTDALERVFQLRRPDLILHLAARVGVRGSVKEPLLYSRVNTTGTLNILEAARRYGVKRIVFGSTSSVYGSTPVVPFREDDPLISPISPYGASKLAAEYYGQVYSRLYGIEFIILRLFTVYGPRQRPDMAIYKFTRNITKGEEITAFGDGTTARDYTYISDILDGVMAALQKGLAGGYAVYNLGNSYPVMLARLLEHIQRCVGRSARIRWLPEQPGDMRVTCADISRSQAELGYQPRVPIEEGLERFIRWYRVTAGEGW
jgi:UDP-glucuronate 4-epimerase